MVNIDNLRNELQDSGIAQFEEESDLRQSLKELNADIVDSDGFTSIDTRTRLTSAQVPSLVALDLMTQCGVLPKKYNRIGRGVKRLSVSIAGGGRKDMVSVVQGVRDHAREEASVVKRIESQGEK